jgi:hypothetical protein
MQHSQFNERLAQAQVGNAVQYKGYGDSAYAVLSHLKRSHRGAQLLPAQGAENQAMSGVRITVEWGFEKPVAEYAFADYKKNLKLFKQPIGRIYFAAVLLANFHTCLYGSQTHEYFVVMPPSLEEYCGMLDML